ncbi:MAG: AAA family ATPase [Chloroflexi bacterium]|nr:AAA family ATPase [Chloroflexota bacterium]
MDLARERALSPEELTRRCPPERFEFATTADLSPASATIGQTRGVASLEFGLAIRSVGYNLYVAGIPGTGKTTTTLALLRRLTAGSPVPPDWCYVYNFADPYRPVAINLPAGQGRQLAEAMRELVEICAQEIPRAFDDERYAQQRGAVAQRLDAARESMLRELVDQARLLGFAVEVGAQGIVSIPIVGDKPMSREDFEQLPEPSRAEIQARHRQLQPAIGQFLLRSRRLERVAVEEARALDRRVALFVVEPVLNELRGRYAAHPRVVEYLNRVQGDLLDNLPLFRGQQQETEGNPPMLRAPSDDPFARYRVNVVVDNGSVEGAAIVVEHSPTYYNLFGRIDYAARLGTMVTDFRMIKAGAIHRANGGFLVVQSRDLLAAPFAWDALKRALRSRAAQPENLGDQFSAVPVATLRPEPISIDVKIILIGDGGLYRLLRAHDDDFAKFFKVRADFDTTMPRTPETEMAYAQFVASRCRDTGLRPSDRSAVARLVDFGARCAADRDKLSTCFADIANVLAEASHWAGVAGREAVTAADVDRTIEQQVYRSRSIEDRLQEMIVSGTVLVDVAGEVVGQVNGLSVISLGDYAFGRPNRITARVGVGHAGVVNIEREIRRSGPAHSKGVLTLAGYLLGQYGQNGPLNLSASLGFEQVYEEIDGDSASSTELYAILSALAELPVRQGLAVTGSVNQRGQVQAIGGVNEKIEGYFAVCQAQGLSGQQGVIIPRSNTRHLMLKDEVVAAVAEGRFSVYAVSSIDEGIELLTGVPAGVAAGDGRYPPESVHGRVVAKLARFSERMRPQPDVKAGERSDGAAAPVDESVPGVPGR